MTSDAWIILVISGLLSFFVGAWLRRVMNRRRFQRSQEALAQMRSAVAERERQAALNLERHARRRQEREAREQERLDREKARKPDAPTSEPRREPRPPG